MKGNISLPTDDKTSETDYMFADGALDVADRQNESMKLDIGDGLTITVVSLLLFVVT